MFVFDSLNTETAEKKMAEIREHRGWYIFEGLFYLLVGILAVIMPGAAVLAAEMLIAAILMIGGIMRIVNGCLRRGFRSWCLISGLVYTLVGLMIWIWPVTGMVALITIVGALLLLEGVFEMGVALTVRPAKNWSWMLVAGIVSIMLGVLIFAGFPTTGILYLAIAIGASFVLYGFSILSLALKSNTYSS